MKEVAAAKLSGENPVNHFYQAISIYLRKTQVVNRKLSCSSNILFIKLASKSPFDEIKTNVIRKLQDFPINQPEDVKKVVQDVGTDTSDVAIDDLKHFDGSENAVYLSVDRMIPRSLEKFKTCSAACFIGE